MIILGHRRLCQSTAQRGNVGGVGVGAAFECRCSRHEDIGSSSYDPGRRLAIDAAIHFQTNVLAEFVDRLADRLNLAQLALDETLAAELRRAAARTPHAAARSVTGRSGWVLSRRKLKSSGAMSERPPGMAARAVRRIAAGCDEAEPTWRSDAAKSLDSVFGTGSDRAVVTETFSSSPSAVFKIPATASCHAAGTSFEPDAAIAPSAVSRAEVGLDALLSASASRSAMAGFFANDPSCDSISRLNASSATGVARRRRKLPARVPAHSGWRPSTQVAILRTEASFDIRWGVTCSPFSPPEADWSRAVSEAETTDGLDDLSPSRSPLMSPVSMSAITRL